MALPAGSHLADAYFDLVRGCATITQVVHATHPRPGACLPLPAISLPQDVEDVRRQLDMLAGNLFDAHTQGVNQLWLTAAQACTHLEAGNVIAIKELYYRWYQLLGPSTPGSKVGPVSTMSSSAPPTSPTRW